MKYVDKEHLIPFALGIGAAILGAKALKSNCVRKAAVNTVAKALVIRDEAAKTVAKMREEAEDIYAEAKEHKKQEALAE